MPSLLEQLREAAARRDTPQAAENSSPAPQDPSQPCSCGFRTFWLDSYGNWSCQSCRPPKLAFMARRTITLGSAGEAEEITAADEARYDKFIEIVGADRRVHLVHRDCLDPASDYFDTTITKKISLGVEEADHEFFPTHRYLSGILAEKNSIDRLPGPWPRNDAGNFSLSSDENSAGQKNKKNAGRKPAARGRKK